MSKDPLEHLIQKETQSQPSIIEAAEPFARAVDAAGVTEDDFTAVLILARDEVRNMRKFNPAANRGSRSLALTLVSLTPSRSRASAGPPTDSPPHPR
jgi:hypothetical protein